MTTAASIEGPTTTQSRATSIDRTPAQWIVSPSYDTIWFFGGAAISVLAAVFALASWLPLVALVWACYLVIDGTHLAAAYTRTYTDPQFRAARPKVFWGTLGIFALGPLMLALNVATGSDAPFGAFLGFASLYAVYHIVRQHYGFLALYKSKNGDRADFTFDKWCLYLGCWLPYGYFLLTHPMVRKLFTLSPALSPFEQGISFVLVGIWLLTVTAFVVRSISRFRPGLAPKLLYVLVTLGMYAFAYGYVARFEPLYPNPQSPDQAFLLLALMASVFHGIQYIGLVWFHNKNRYKDGLNRNGLASWINRSQLRYLGLCALFVPVYLVTASMTAVFPGSQSLVGLRIGSITANQLALCFFWGIALHHFVLDQYIWRIGQDSELRRALDLMPKAKQPVTS